MKKRYENKWRKLCGTLVMCLTFFPFPLSAQVSYTLDECVAQALKNNARMKNAANDLAAAQEGKKSAFTKYFPSISASGFGFLADKDIIKMDVMQGMSLSLVKNGVAGGVTASVPLFAGGQIVNGNRLAEVNVEKYHLLQRTTENEVRLTVEQYFWQVVLLKEKLKTLDAVDAQLTSLQKDVEAAVQAGVANRNDLLQVQLQQNDIQSSRLTVESGLTLSRRQLAQYMGLSPTDSMDVNFQADDSLPPSPVVLYTDPQASLERIPEYHLLQAQVKATRLARKMTTGKQLPTVAVGGGYLYDNLTDRDKPFWAGFATVSIPLSGWWGGSHDIRQQRYAERTAQNNLKDQSQLLIIRMQNAWDNLNDAYRQMQIARRSIEQSTENLRLYADYYAAGTRTMSDLLEAQTLYRQSRDKYVESYAQYEVKKREYLQATGQ